MPLEISVDEEVRLRGCLETIFVQAKVAALLAPGPLVILDGVDRTVREDLSDFPDRRVVRMLCLSGLGDRFADEFLVTDGPYGGNNGGRVDIEGSDWLPIAGCSLELLCGNDGRFGKGGFDNSVYVIAGIVPSPMNPFPGVLLPDDDDAVGPFLAASTPASDGVACVDGSSSRDILRASRRSILSLH